MSENNKPKKRQIKTLLVTLAAAGTPQKLSADNIEALDALVQAVSGNTSDVIIGDENIDFATGQGDRFSELGAYAVEGVRLDQIYFDGFTTGDKVSVTYTITR